MKAAHRRIPVIPLAAHDIAPILLLLATVVFWGLPSRVSAQALQVQITELQCSRDPEVVALTNQGSSAQDLTGWSLKSDPVASESFDLTPVGTLAPGVTVFVQSGPAANGTFIWSPNFVFRDGDASDFARIVDANGNVVHEVSCQGTSPVPTGTTTSTPTAAPTRSPTVTTPPAPADVIPVGGGPPGSSQFPLAMLVLAAGLVAIGLGASALFMQTRPSRQAITHVQESPQRAVGMTREATARWLFLLILAALVALAAWVSPSGDRNRGGES